MPTESVELNSHKYLKHTREVCGCETFQFCITEYGCDKNWVGNETTLNQNTAVIN